MSGRPVFSIITPTRDRREWLPRCIESVKAQSYSDWEHVILDNGTEAVADLIDDPRQKYFRVPPRAFINVATTFNWGIEVATGDIIHPLSDDDRLAPDALSKVAAGIGDRDWLIGGTLIHDVDETWAIRRGGNRDSLEATLAGSYMLGGAVYWRKDLSQQLGAYDPAFDGAADFDLYKRFARHGEPAIIPDALYLYTDWPGTDSRQRSTNQHEQARRIAQAM